MDLSDVLAEILKGAVKLDREKIEKTYKTAKEKLGEFDDTDWLAETIVTELLLGEFYVQLTNIYADIQEKEFLTAVANKEAKKRLPDT